jgi:V-type H+-transporting ATPase subunit a
MTFALCLQVPNHFKFKRYSDLYTNFIPQIIFLQSIFGYLALCILYKWSIDWSTASTQPPSLLNMLISMFLQPGTVDPKTQLYRGQGFVQVVLLGLAGICVPWLLIAKPYLEWRKLNRTHAQGYMSIGEGHGENDGLPYTPGAVRVSMEDEEEGNGGAVLAQAAEEEGVRVLLFFLQFTPSLLILSG